MGRTEHWHEHIGMINDKMTDERCGRDEVL